MEEKKKSRLPLIVIIVFILVLVALYAYLYLLPGIKESQAETSVVYYTRVQNQQQSKCIVVREEHVVKTAVAGSVTYFVDEGVKTRKYSKLADVYGADRNSLYSSATGFVSYYLDGYEEYFSPESFSDLDPSEVAELKDITPQVSKPASAEKDQALLKVVISDVWYVLIVDPVSAKESYTVGQNISVQMPDGFVAAAQVEELKEDDAYRLTLASVRRYYEKFTQLRCFDAPVISAVSEGLLVPSDSLATNGENIGVYVRGLDGEYVFKAVEIITQTPDGILVQDGGSLKQYDEVLNDARKYQE